MKPYTSIPLAAGAVLAALGLWWLAGLGDVHPAGPDSLPPSVPESAAPAPDLERAGSTPVGERTASDPKRPEELPPELPGTIEGTVVDSGNRPVSGVEVRAVVGLEREDLERTVSRTRSDSDGRFAIEVAVGRELELRATAPGFAVGVVSAVRAGDHATILLRHGAILAGTARRKEGGAPVAGARVILVSPEGNLLAPAWESRTDEKGAYFAQNLPPGAYHMHVFPERLASSIDSVTLAEGESRTLDISIPTGTTVLGEVKDAETGFPIAGAEVSASPFELHSVRTDEEGRYELAASIGEGSTILISARAPGYGVYEAEAVATGASVLEANFELAKSRGAHGRVVSRQGAPIADASVLAYAARWNGGWVRSDRKTARTGNDGRFELSDLRTDLAHGIFVRKERFAESHVKSIEAGVAGEVDLGDLVVSPGASLEGTVATAAGDRVQAAGVVLVPESCAEPEPCPLQRHSTTDARGVFRFADLAAGTFRIDVHGVGLPPTKKGWTVVLAEGEAKRGFQIVVGEGRSIGGRVVDARGLGVEGAEIELFAAGSETSSNLRSQSLADGRFQVNGLEDAPYDIEARFPGEYGPPDDRHDLIGARAERVAPGTTDLVLDLRRAAALTGRVAGLAEDLDLHPVILAVDGEGRRVAAEPLALHGRFALRVPAGEFVELRVWTDAPLAIARGRSTSDPDHPPQAVRTGVRAGDGDVVLVVNP